MGIIHGRCTYCDETKKIPWQKSDIVQVVQLIQTENPANSRRKLWFFRIHEYVLDEITRSWETYENAEPIPKEWFKTIRHKKAPAN